jgi:hypothetical protein
MLKLSSLIIGVILGLSNSTLIPTDLQSLNDLIQQNSLRTN